MRFPLAHKPHLLWRLHLLIQILNAAFAECSVPNVELGSRASSPSNRTASSWFPFRLRTRALLILRIPLVPASGFAARPLSMAASLSPSSSHRQANSFHAGAN